MNAPANNTRNLKLRKLHVLARDQGLSEDEYRDRLERITGKRSAKDCDDAELDKVLASFHVKQANNAHTAKAKALFIAAFNLGLFENGTDHALDRFVERQTRCVKLAWLTPTDANKVTEALKAMCARAGFVPPDDGIEARRALLRAQWALLGTLGQTRVQHEWGLDGWISHRIVPRKDVVDSLKRHELDQAAIQLGRWIRSVQAPRSSSAAVAHE